MAFPKNLLNENEEIVLYRHPHWSFLLGGLGMILAGIVVAVVISILVPVFWWAGILIVVFAIVGSAGRYLRWRTIEFVVTTDRVIVRQGVLAKAGIEIPLDRIMNISYRQSLYERLLGTGDLVIESAGENGRQAFTDVSNPSYVQNIIYRQTELYQAGRSGSVRTASDGMGDTDAPSPGKSSGSGRLSIPDQIERLAALKDKGILSDAEFQEKKQMLLDRM